MLQTWDLYYPYYMSRGSIAEILGGGDRRSIGRSNEVAAVVSEDPKRFPELLSILSSSDRLVRMRAADAAEKVTRRHPGLLVPYKKKLLKLLRETEEQELQWHLAAMVPRLPLTSRERDRAASSLKNYLSSPSSIVKTSALQAMADLARDDPRARSRLMPVLRAASRTGTAAMRARSRHLLRQLQGKGRAAAATSVREYLARVPEPARGSLQKIRALIRSVVPATASEKISYGIPSFQYKGWLVGYAAFADHCSFFPGALPKEFAKDLKNFPTSKGTIRFRVDKPLPASLVKKLVKARLAQKESKKMR